MQATFAGRTGWTVTALIGLVAVLVSGAFGYSFWSEYRNMRLRAEQRALDTAHTATEHIRWLVEASRQSLRAVDSGLPADPAAFATADAAFFRERLPWLPANAVAWVFDAEGNGQATSEPALRPLSIADMDHFQALKAGLPFTISRLTKGRLSQRAVFVLLHRLERNGRFAGAASIVIPASVMAEFYETLGLSRRSTIGLFRDDGWLVMRQPVPPETLNLSQYVLFTDLLPKADSGIYSVPSSPADGNSRLVAYRRVPGLPLVTVVGISWDDEVDGLVTRLFAMGAATLLAYAGVVALAAWTLLLLTRDARTRQRLTAALEQNGLLLREVHHRVKNNLQIISGLVHLQGSGEQAKAELIRRIGAMAAVHEQIYTAGRFSSVDVPDYLRRVIDGVRTVRGTPVQVVYEMEPLEMEIESALPLGLIASEAVANVLKHAWSGDAAGTITVRLFRPGSGTARLEVADTGQGFDATQPTAGLGRRLIDSLAQQLGGNAELRSGAGGTLVAVDFPVLPAVAP